MIARHRQNRDRDRPVTDSIADRYVRVGIRPFTETAPALTVARRRIRGLRKTADRHPHIEPRVWKVP